MRPAFSAWRPQELSLAAVRLDERPITQRGRGLFNLSTMPNGLIGGPAGDRATGKIARDRVGRAERHIDILAEDGRSGAPARAAVVRFALQTGILVAALLTAGLLGGAAQRRLVTAAAIGRRTLRHLQLRANGLPALLTAGQDRAGTGDRTRVGKMQLASLGRDLAQAAIELDRVAKQFAAALRVVDAKADRTVGAIGIDQEQPVRRNAQEIAFLGMQLPLAGNRLIGTFRNLLAGAADHVRDLRVADFALVEFLHHQPREIEAADLLFGRWGGIGRTELDGSRFRRLLERRLAVITGGESRERRRERKRDSG